MATYAATYGVGPGQVFATPDVINWSIILPGDVITIHSGTYTTAQGGNSMTLSGVVGTQANPIVVNALAGQMPKLLNGINITNGTKFVTIDGLDVTRNPTTQQYAAVIIQGRSSNVTISDSNIHNAYVGVNVSGAGLNNSIYHNYIYGNLFQGVTVGAPDPSITPVANTQSVTSNSIYSNGTHGIEITGPYWTVEHNSVTGNGVSNTGGISGIHLFSTGSAINAVGGCNNNLVSYNYLSGQIDTVGADGNGIQIDNFCDSNKITFNVSWGNDGAGISLLTGYGNTIRSNTSYANERDLGRASRLPGVIQGEIITASFANLCSNPNVSPSYCNVPAGRASNNIIYDNIAYSSQSIVPVIYVSQDFLTTSRNTNHFYPNMFYNSAGGTELYWGSYAYNTPSTIDTAVGTTGDVVGSPAFANTSSPGAGSDGLRLLSAPANQGWVVSPAAPDMLGNSATGSTYYYGAYYFH